MLLSKRDCRIVEVRRVKYEIDLKLDGTKLKYVRVVHFLKQTLLTTVVFDTALV
jgi:hypothetical protein